LTTASQRRNVFTTESLTEADPNSGVWARPCPERDECEDSGLPVLIKRRPDRGPAEARMYRTCPTCGIEVRDQLRCPLCDATLVRVNLRRTLMWALVVEEWLLLLSLVLRRA